MKQQEASQNGTRCLLCTNQVEHQDDVCPQCDPRYIALGKAPIEYERQFEPISKASPHKYIGAPMRFVLDVHFFLKALDMPNPYEGQRITYRLSVISIIPGKKEPIQRDSWYRQNIPSTFMAATISRSPTSIRFPEKPGSFVPIASWKPDSYTHGQPGNDNTRGGESHDRRSTARGTEGTKTSLEERPTRSGVDIYAPSALRAS